MRFAITLPLLLLALTVAAAQPGAVRDAPPGIGADLPDTVAGRRFAEWLMAFNGPPAGYGEYIRRHAPALEKWIGDDVRFAEVTGGFRVLRVGLGSAYALTGLLAEPWWDPPTTFTIEVESAPPHRITRLDLGRGERPPDLPLPQLDDAALVAALAERLDAQAAAGRFSGVVRLARGEHVLLERAHGFADAAQTQAIVADTRFGIASMGKMFTAVAVMQLVEAGRLDLQAPLRRYLPEYPNAELGAATLHQLLTHTAGAGDIFVKATADLAGTPSPADYIARLGARAPHPAPGGAWRYSNYGYVLLGRVIEVASGRPYFDYLREHVFMPAGMTRTGPDGGAASPRTRGEGGLGWVAAAPGLPSRASPAGGMRSTAGDLHAFVRALHDGRLLAPATLATLTTGRVEMPYGRYAYGFTDQRRGRKRHYGHGGAAPGHNTQLDHYPESGITLIVLSNQDPPYANRIADFVGERLPDR
jgi:D-alanyl-D-alanine carboxypeptidase